MVAGINNPQVSAWLAAHVTDSTPPFTFTLIAGGHSNLTYRCTDAAGRHLVLRRPPLGQVLQSAHDVGREHRLMAALAGSGVPVPCVHGLCTDATVNDGPFMLMAYVEGVVLHDAAAAALAPPADRRALSEHVIDVLAALHRVDPNAVGLGDLGRHDGYVARQIKRWTQQWEATRTDPLPAMDAASRLLTAGIPAQLGTAIVHGDYRLGNLLVADGRVQAVLDWELCTLGDALADLGYLLNHWADVGEAAIGISEQLPTSIGGFMSRADMLARYAAQSGRDVSQIDYYRALALWRTAAIRQGVYRRYVGGAMAGQPRVGLEEMRLSVAHCAEAALELLGR